MPRCLSRSFAPSGRGSIRLTTQTNVFAGLTNFTGRVDSSYQGRAEFPGLTQLNATNYSVVFSADSGGVVDLSHVTNAVAKAYSLALSASYGGRIDIPNLETIVAGQVDVRADGTDAVVDLSGLTGFFSDNNSSSLRITSSGVILLNSDAMLLAGVAIDFKATPAVSCRPSSRRRNRWSSTASPGGAIGSNRAVLRWRTVRGRSIVECR